MSLIVKDTPSDPSEKQRLRAKILARDLYLTLRELLKDDLYQSQVSNSLLQTLIFDLQIQNQELLDKTASLEQELQTTKTERYENKYESKRKPQESRVETKENDDLELTLAGVKTKLAEALSGYETLQDDLKAEQALLKLRDREIEHLNRELETLRKQNLALAGKKGSASLKSSRAATPVKAVPSGIEKGAIRPYPGLFSFGKDEKMERRLVPGSGDLNVGKLGPRPGVNSSMVSNVKFE